MKPPFICAGLGIVTELAGRDMRDFDGLPAQKFRMGLAIGGLSHSGGRWQNEIVKQAKRSKL